MKDFKTMPKMACGGGVKKYNEGRSVTPVEMPSRFGSSAPKTRNIDGEDVPVNPTSTKTRGNLDLLKKGGKVKRGSKK